jgi:hypothetical protein
MVTLMYTSVLKVCFFQLNFCCIQIEDEVAQSWRHMGE